MNDEHCEGGASFALQRHKMRFRRRSRRGFTNLMAADWQRQRERPRRLVGGRKIGRWRTKRRLSIPVGDERELLVRNDWRKPVFRLLDQAVGWLVRRKIVRPVPILPAVLRVLVGWPVWAVPVVPA